MTKKEVEFVRNLRNGTAKAVQNLDDYLNEVGVATVHRGSSHYGEMLAIIRAAVRIGVQVGNGSYAEIEREAQKVKA